MLKILNDLAELLAISKCFSCVTAKSTYAVYHQHNMVIG